MKKIVLLLAVFVAVSCGNKQSQITTADDVKVAGSGDKSNLPDIKFTDEIHDFGKLAQGEKVSYAFVFKNTGKSNLVITSASGSCGCTVPNYPKQPIAPGQENKIDVTFDSANKSGMVEKTVTLVTNGEPSTRVLKIKAEVIVPTANPNDPGKPMH